MEKSQSKKFDKAANEIEIAKKWNFKVMKVWGVCPNSCSPSDWNGKCRVKGCNTKPEKK